MADTQRNQSRWQIPFFTIWTGQAFSLVGSRVLEFAVIWWLTRLTGSATVLAMATLTFVLPQVFLSPFAGALVDRWNRRVVMVVADGTVALVALGLAYLFWAGKIQVWHVFVALLVRAIGGNFHWPAMQASTSLMVPDRHLTRVAGLNQTMQGALNVIGPPLGAMLLAVLPFQGIMLMDVGTALFAILPLFFVRIPQPRQALVEPGDGREGEIPRFARNDKPGDGREGEIPRCARNDKPGDGRVGEIPRCARNDRGKPSLWSDVRQGLRYVWGWPGLLAIMIMATILNFVINPAFSLMPLLVTDHFKGGALQLGWLESAWGVGLVVGGLVLSTWGGFRRRVYTSLTGLVVQGVGIMLLGLTPANALWLAVAAMFLAGAMNALVNGPLFAVLQGSVAPEMQGRVFTVVMSMSAAAWPLSLAVAGPIADLVGVRPWYVVGGAVAVIMGLGAFFVPVIVNVEQNRNGAASVKAETRVPVAVPVSVETD